MKQAKCKENLKTALRICLIAVVLFTINGKIQAQDESPLALTVRGGINFSNSTSGTTTTRTGYMAGLVLDYGQTLLFVRTGLDFTSKGVRYTRDANNPGGGSITGLPKEYGRYTINLLSFQLPIHVAYRATISESASVVVHGGPFISYAFSGNVQNDETGVKSRVLGQHLLYRYDYGLGIGVSGEFNNVVLSAGGDFGLTNLNEDGYGSNKSKVFFVTLGYKFKL